MTSATVTRGGHPPATARALLWAVVLANLAVVEFMFFTAEPSKNALVATGKWLGLHLALLMILQLVLVARLPFLDRRLGMDRLTSLHRLVGLAVFWVVLAHPTFVILGFSRYDRLPVSREISNLAGIFATLTGMLAAAAMVVAIGFSVRLVRRRLPYELWHAIHLLMYAAITLALIHQAYEASTVKESPWRGIYWWTLWTVAIASLLIGRFVLPLRRNLRHRLRVSAVVPESDGVVSVYVTGRDLDRLPARAGQFFIWRFPRHHGWWRANPFSLSAAPDGRSLRLTAKGVGRASAGLRRLAVGTRVFAEGPYGALTTLNRSRERTLLIAGGIGVTPVRALLEELSGDVVVLYRVQSEADAVLLPELRELAVARGARVEVLSGRTGAGDPPNTPFAAATLRERVPDIGERDVFVCGPPSMMDAVVRTLRELGLAGRQIHAERFSLAG
jgi:predicted ferric reductase